MHPINEHKEDETLSGRLETLISSHEKSHTFTHSLFVFLCLRGSSLLFRLSTILIWSASRRRMRRRRCHWCQAFLIPASKQERREERRIGYWHALNRCPTGDAEEQAGRRVRHVKSPLSAFRPRQQPRRRRIGRGG